MTVPPGLVTAWETAYRQYTSASERAARAGDDVRTVHAMASASWDVASVWRDIATSAVLPWWTLAAVRAAADAFEAQARDWHARATHGQGRPAIHGRGAGRAAGGVTRHG